MEHLTPMTLRCSMFEGTPYAREEGRTAGNHRLQLRTIGGAEKEALGGASCVGLPCQRTMWALAW